MLEANILQAENQYSEDQPQALFDEPRDANSRYAELPYAFIGSAVTMTQDVLETKIPEIGVPAEEVEEAITILLWFGFLGILDAEWPVGSRNSVVLPESLKTTAHCRAVLSHSRNNVGNCSTLPQKNGKGWVRKSIEEAKML